MQVYVNEETGRRLFKAASEMGREVEDLASAAIEEAALEFFRHRSDGPANPA